MPVALIDALIRQGATDLTVVSTTTPATATPAWPRCSPKGRVRKMICSFPRQSDSWVFDELYRDGRIELEVVPQGNLAERMRAAGAGIGAFFCPTGVGTPLAEGKETREIDGRDYVLEYPIRGDVGADRRPPGRPDGQPRLPQDRTQLRAGDGHGGRPRRSPR